MSIKCEYCDNPARLNLTLLRECDPSTGESFEERDDTPWDKDGDAGPGPYGHHWRTVPVCCFGMRFGTIDLCETFAQCWNLRDDMTIVDENGHVWRDMTTADPQPANGERKFASIIDALNT